jgi:hypothetical protein
MLSAAAWAAPGDQIDKLTADDAAQFDQFGFGADIDQNTTVIGANQEGPTNTFVGAAYVFNAETGAQLHKLFATDGEAFDFFGSTVAVFGSAAAIGAPGEDTNGSGAGAVYLFDASAGIQTAKLLAPDGASSDGFGQSLDIHGSTVLVGAPGNDDSGGSTGSAYLFNAVDGSFVRKILGSGTNTSDEFGTSVAVHGTIAVVGAPGVAPRGRAYILDLAGETEIAVIEFPETAFNARFGSSVDTDGATVIIGAEKANGNQAESGAAYLYDTSGNYLRKLTAPDGRSSDDFGLRDVAVQGNLALVGAPGHPNHGGTLAGAAYLFDITTGDLIDEVLPTDLGQRDQFGRTVALSGARALVSSPFDSHTGPSAGSAYLFETGVTPPQPCIDADLAAPFGLLDLADINAFVAGFVAMDPIADLTSDGLYDLADINLFVSSFVGGCP